MGNLQKTAFDDYCAVRIFAKIDDVMEGLMRELALDIPEWSLQRLLKLSVPALAPKQTAKSSLTTPRLCASKSKSSPRSSNRRSTFVQPRAPASRRLQALPTSVQASK